MDIDDFTISVSLKVNGYRLVYSPFFGPNQEEPSGMTCRLRSDSGYTDVEGWSDEYGNFKAARVNLLEQLREEVERLKKVADEISAIY